MKYAIITPTYINHFQYINTYLKSFSDFVEDKKEIPIFFTISKEEFQQFDKIISKYKNGLNLNILFFEDLLKENNIEMSPQDYMEKYGKFTFQTAKKFYTMLYVNAEKFLVLDCESMWIKPTNMTNLFVSYFNEPFISGSSISQRKAIHPFTQGVIDNRNFLINQKCDKWFLENFVWFYDKKILQNMFDELGSPTEMAEKVFNRKNKQLTDSGIFEIEIYHAYLYTNLEKYGYKFVDVNDLFETCLSKEEQVLYLNKYNDIFDGNCSLFEHTLMLLDELNYKPLAETFKNNNFNIIRCERSNLDNIKLQEEFIKIVQPNILAASQEHAFGINDKYKILVLRNKYYYKLQKHISNLIHPGKLSMQLLIEPFSVIFYFVKWQLKKRKTLKKYKELYE